MACVGGITSTVARLSVDDPLTAPTIVDPILSGQVAQVARGTYELSISHTTEVVLQAKPRELNKGDIIAVHETLFNKTWFGIITEIEYRLTIEGDALVPSMSLTVGRFYENT